MKFRLTLLLAVSLAACGAPAPEMATQACEAQKAAEMPVTDENGFISAPAEIDHKPVTMLVDSGAERSMVTPATVSSLALSADRRRRTTVLGTGGSIASQNVTLPSVGVGGMEMLDQSAIVGAFPVLRGPSLHAAGLIGADWLSDFGVDLDLPHQRIALYRLQGCSPGYVPWPGSTASVPLTLFRGDLPLVAVTLDSHRVTAMLDSGARSSVLGQAAAERIGVTAAAMQGDRLGRSMGVDGATRETHLHQFGQLQVGEIAYVNPRILISPLSTPVVEMLLGADWLRQNRVWINYAGRRLAIQRTTSF